MTSSGAPSAREHAAVAASGGLVFVWGGRDGSSDLADGGLYDPKTDVWKDIVPGDSTPSPRVFAAAVPVGSTVVVWGGGPSGGSAALGGGARYDLASGTWTGMSAAGAPAARRAPIAVWTGSHVLLWGGVANGSPVGGGALYDPVSDSWAPVSDTGAPSSRSGLAGAWSGTELYLFGGRPNGTGETDEGFAYDPAKNQWRSLPAAGAPSARYDAFAVWVNGMLVVWGGESSDGPEEDGARYDPAADAWSPISGDNEPSKRSRRAGWSGWVGATATRGVVFGGMDDSNVKTDGRLFDPIANVWGPTGSATREHRGGAGVWTGAEIVLWSGRDGSSLDASGERYMP